MRAADRIALPLDVPTLAQAQAWIDRMRGEVGVFKVGLQLFTAAGPAAVRAVHDAGAACFLDLKLHDIPATVACAVRAAVDLGVRYLTVHCASAPAGLSAAARAAEGSATTLLGVTVLTSLDASDLAAIGVRASAAEAVSARARMAIEAGLGGLVASPHEVATLRAELGAAPTLVVPGIRPRGSSADDQARIATPAEAIAAGADLLVVGRPIRNAPDPVLAARAIAEEIAGATP